MEMARFREIDLRKRRCLGELAAFWPNGSSSLRPRPVWWCMAKVIAAHGYRLFFYSNEGLPREPVHVHVRRGSGLAKVWLEPHIEIAECLGFARNEKAKLLRIVADHEELTREIWHAYFD